MMYKNEKHTDYFAVSNSWLFIFLTAKSSVFILKCFGFWVYEYYNSCSESNILLNEQYYNFVSLHSSLKIQ